ncbi:MAG TPA: hypothetical protein VNM48_09585 [Chloroflexota bacterium]|nr:hypothetical protein [Chloroflexota bacterium]
MLTPATAPVLLERLASCTPEERAFVFQGFSDADFAALEIALAEESGEPGAVGDWESWLRTIFPAYVSDHEGVPIPFAAHHRVFWEWVWSIRKGERVRPFIAIWPRGGAKSTSAEMACVALGARKARRYGLYICATQEQADDHVGTVGMMLESDAVARHYPELASRLMGKFGNSRGWRRNRLRTAAGFTLDAIGLDSAARGVKLEEERPDLLLIDDIDNEHDSDATVEKKIATLTRGLLPAGAADVAVVGAQNLVHPNSVFSQLADGRADFLADRLVSGPHPAVLDLAYEERDGRAVVTGGTPTWQGMDLARCQQAIDDWGLTSFLAEAQHQVSVLRQHIFLPEWWADGRNRYDADWHGAAQGDAAGGGQLFGRFLFFDTAMKDKVANDSTACTVFEVLASGNVRVRHVWERKLPFPDLVPAIEQTALEWNRDKKLRGVSIEDRNSGTSAIQTIKAGSPVWLASLTSAFEPTGSKEYRARQVSMWCARGGVLLPHPSATVPWLLGFEQELYDFPSVLHDDRTDTFTQGLLFLENHLRKWWAARTASAGTAAPYLLSPPSRVPQLSTPERMVYPRR